MELLHINCALAIIFAIYVMACERVAKNRRMKAAAKRVYCGSAL